MIVCRWTKALHLIGLFGSDYRAIIGSFFRTTERRNRPQNVVYNTLPKHFWVLVALVCFSMSILAQTGLPLFLDLLKNTACLNPFYDDSTKKSYGCGGYNLAKKASPPKTNLVKRITYFDEPFPVEPWSNNGDVDSGELYEEITKIISNI